MRRSISSLVVAAAIGAGAVGGVTVGSGAARACTCTETTAGRASDTRAFAESAAPAAVPDTTVAPAGEADEDRTAGYVVMVVAVLVFVGGFAIIAVRARRR